MHAWLFVCCFWIMSLSYSFKTQQHYWTWMLIIYCNDFSFIFATIIQCTFKHVHMSSMSLNYIKDGGIKVLVERLLFHCENIAELKWVNTVINVNSQLFNKVLLFFCMHSLSDNGLTDDSIPYLISLIESARNLELLVVEQDK